MRYAFQTSSQVISRPWTHAWSAITAVSVDSAAWIASLPGLPARTSSTNSFTWSIVMSNKGNPSRFDVAWGRDDDAPMAFDYDQDGKADLVLRRPGGFDILLSSKGFASSVAVR